MKTIFIAYNHKDKVIARFIYHALLREPWEDVEIFMDEFSIQPGEDIKQRCLETAKRADLGVVILSEYTQKSEYVPQEVGILLLRDIPKIYIALYESWKIPPGYEKTIKSFLLYDEKNPFEGINKLTELVRNILKPQETGPVELLNKGAKLANQGKFDEALGYAERAIRIDPNYDEAYLAKIENLRKLRRYDEAFHTIEEALRIFGDNIRFLSHKAFLLYSVKRYSQAKDIYDKIIDMTDRKDQNALYYKGRCFERLKMLHEAIKVFDECYKINPSSTLGIKALRIKGTLAARIKIENVKKEHT